MILSAACLGSCNSDSKESDNVYVPSSSVAVTAFTLKADKDVVSGLDSVFFSIDLNAGVIANPDSLPVGTRVDKLVPAITYPSTVTSAVITMTGGSTRTGEVDYRSNPTDSIDFTGRVTLRLKAEDGQAERTYLLKVNVHKSTPDTLAWERIDLAGLPSRLGAPRAQSTVKYRDLALSIIEESDGSMTLAKSAAPAEGNWTKTSPSLPQGARIETLTATDDALYMLGAAGELYTSADGARWSDTGVRWASITGGYGTALLGIRATASGAVHTSWPASAGIAESPVEAAFPVEGTTTFGLFKSKWAAHPSGFFTGGRMADGTVSNATWAFDGLRWAVITENPAPALTDACMVPYYAFNGKELTRYPVWMLIGGRLADGSQNREVWLTYDNGANWRRADVHMQLPESLPWLEKADGITLTTPRSADLNEGWTSTSLRTLSPWMRKAAPTVSDGIVRWECPYIYLFGGLDADGRLNDRVMRGVLMRLAFTPLI